jgi:hypothetical protein
LCELKHEVFGKTVSIPPDSLVENFRRDSVQSGKVSIEHHLVAANEIDPAGDAFNGNDGARRCRNHYLRNVQAFEDTVKSH